MSTTQPFKSAFRLEAEATGMVKAILKLLEIRGIVVPEAARARVTACTDFVQLDVWAERAVTVTSVEELFGG